ncbi:SusC/RagA family TonB-linked outer membrane protein [Pedobacter sp. L105]|uniref:SusC/RagA family TonB-linked outer membrane protein n=1 Tax=Pedobacter sp. L105 TaxID=1641871 RepID=UPI00131CF60A|nr:SusC/RagA family TonB-linked outer membrane protein [Pedobacter sp. L105]
MNQKLLLKKIIFSCICALFFCGSAFSQTIVLKGKVTDTKGIGLPGVSVKIKGTTKGTLTGADGAFSLPYKGEATLIISAISYTTKEIALSSQKNLTVSLEEDNQNLDEVVVTALGIKREKRMLTYASTEIKSDELVQTKEPNLVNALAGKASGVQVTSSSGSPGSSSRIVIRGGSSLYGNNQALMVIDGIPVDNSETGNIASGPGTNRIADLDPSIVESMNILKGSAATALYGSAGANGVIIITTKNGGGSKKPTINFSSDFSVETAIIPQIQNKYSLGTNGVYYDGVTNKTSTSWGAEMDTLMINGAKAKVYDQSALFFQTGKTYNNTFNIGGGSGESNSYFISYGNFNQTGTVPTTKYVRNSFFGKYSAKILKNLNTTFSLNYTNSNKSSLPEGYDLGSPVWTIFTAPVSYDLQPSTNADGTQRLFRYSRNNPYWVENNVGQTAAVNRFMPTFNADYKPISWLTITERFGADVYTEQDNYHENVGSVSNPTGRITVSNNIFRQFNNDLIASASHQSGDFTFDGILGNNVFSQYSENSYGNGLGLTVAGLNNISSASTVTYTENHYLQRKIGFYLQGNIDYKHFLELSLTGRYDGNSVLAEGNNFYPYGSAATSFILSQFFNDGLKKVMNLAKIRVSYGTVGNDGSISPYSLTTTYLTQSGGSSVRNINFPYAGQSGFLLNQTLANATLKNERLDEFEAGFETGFLNNRITFEGSFYSKNTIGGIIPTVGIAPSSGYAYTTVNSAQLQIRGMEASMNIVPVKSKDFQWDMTLNWSKYKSTVAEIYPGIDQIANGFTTIVKGQSYGTIVGTRYARSASGKILTDASGLPVADATQGIIGNIIPKYMASINNNFRYKQWNASFFFDFKKGGDIQNNVDSYGYFYGTPKVTENRAPRVVDGINEDTGLPNTVSVTGQAYYQRLNGITESVIQDGTYLKLRNASIGYNINPSSLKKGPFKAISLTVTGRNLWIYAPHFTGGDPEVSSFGSSNGSQGIYSFSVPTSRSFDLSLKLTL